MFNNIKTNFVIARTFIGFSEKNASFSSFIVTGNSGLVMLQSSIYISNFIEDVSTSLASFGTISIKYLLEFSTISLTSVIFLLSTAIFSGKFCLLHFSFLYYLCILVLVWRNANSVS